MTPPLNKELIAFKVDTEGLDYSICDYFSEASVDEMERIDPELAAAWREARVALLKVRGILEPYMP